ncbi:GDP-mannose transporter into the lumen of the Golgi [Puccinia graminis f. sp. tritici]|uniref:GDP-mannose transporter n=2 Tax=Puccinia graminis f. sp. tritici TaxID=56615 RepID=E3L0I2_PUCGT|nr:uncharacterized protein PGTG_15928 [Puccinia graminis f. sp. tritici CRL 75-36-700-3]KAA1088184.1 GDP-mannose transporter into the lumen of the Golgi [Puccinia graminis f. sp. tritici]EFP90080.1 hypothetical protein PGTG_15928 [Puccinia graminis f. sp. tritici CRL 75-36-700-3]KAA1096178.1 GDP-mannose transporter into the lumen of the Golgi [Puccinia graminis f. sp. tritici]KAA1104930.1 GDP-mannose transporter into the lumen of the Golgi [Puccinia graminis f. sp. tritici]KAA1112704.1 GDP-man
MSNNNAPSLPTFIGNLHVGPGSKIDRLSNNPVLPVFSYCAASILMTVINKFVVSGRHFSMNFLLLTIQSVVCVGCVATSKSLRLIKYRDLDKNDAKRWFPISFLLVVVIYTGSKALQFLTIPVYTIFKNLTIILIAYGEVIWFNGSVSSLTLVSFGLMVLSSLIAAWSDISPFLSINSAKEEAFQEPLIYGEIVKKNMGYFWMLINCFASAAYVLAMRKKIKLTNFKDWDTMFYNNLLSIPILIVFSLAFEDWSQSSLSLNFPSEGRNFLLAAMSFSGAAAVFISYTTAWCVRTTSSTTYSMVGALNKLPVAASGMIFFGDPVTFGNVTAVSTGFVAGLVYAIAKTNQQKNNNSNGAGNGSGTPGSATQPLLFQKDIKA